MRGISNQGINDLYAQFSTTTLTSADEGKAVAFTGNNQVGLGAAGNAFVGKLIRVEKDNTCLVQIGGNMKIGYNETITRGNKVVVDGAGKVRDVATETNGRGLICSIDATNVEVELFL